MLRVAGFDIGACLSDIADSAQKLLQNASDKDLIGFTE